MYRWIKGAKRPQQKPKMHFRNSIDKSLTAFKICQDNLKNDVTDQLKWRKHL